LAALTYADGERWRRRRQLADDYEQVMTGRARSDSGGGKLDARAMWLRIVRWLVSWQIDLIRLKMSPEPPRLSNPDLRSLLRAGPSGKRRASCSIDWTRPCACIHLCVTTQVNMLICSWRRFLGDVARMGNESGFCKQALIEG
jgi:hypothetical protein